jgi:hypothetical protein
MRKWLPMIHEWLVVAGMLAMPMIAQAQTTTPEMEVDRPKMNKKLGLGIFSHIDGRLMTAYFDFRLLPCFSLEPNVGFTRYGQNDFPFTPSQKTIFTKFTMGADAKLYFLFNRRHPLEGIHATLHGSFFRLNTWAMKDDYQPYRSYHSKAGVGIGGNYYFYRRFSVGSTVYICYTKGADVLINPNGTTRRIQRRSGFVMPYSFQIGISF